MQKVLCAGIGATILTAGCGNGRFLTGPGGGRGGEQKGATSGVEQISSVIQYPGRPMIQAPDKVNVGLGFDVSFTAGLGGCDNPDVTTSETDAASITLTPHNRDVHDSTYALGEVCPDYLTWAVRYARAAGFTTPGFDTLNIYAYTTDSLGNSHLGNIQKIIEVLP